MKKYTTLTVGLLMSLSLFANQPSVKEGLDDQLFLQPYLNELTGQSTQISVNIGARLPSTTHFISDEVCKEMGLGTHFKLMAEKCETAAKVIVTAPASFGVLFTDNSSSEDDVIAHINQVLTAIGNTTDEQVICSHLNQLEEVTRATFVQKEEGLQLVTDEKALRLGERVWRKLPASVETAVYHSEEEYLVAFANAGFTVEEIKRPCFEGELKYKMHLSSLNAGEKGLGRAYVQNNPYTIFYLVKK